MARIDAGYMTYLGTADAQGAPLRHLLALGRLARETTEPLTAENYAAIRAVIKKAEG